MAVNNTNNNVGSNTTLINTGLFTIKGNVMTFNTHLLQLSNITRVWTGQLPKKPLAKLPLIVLIIVCYLFFRFNIIWAAVLTLLVIIYLVYSYSKQTIYHGINIEISSAQIYSFICDNENNVKIAFDCLSDCISKRNNNNIYEINMNNGIINKGEINNSKVIGQVKSNE